MLETALDLGLAQECNQGELKPSWFCVYKKHGRENRIVFLLSGDWYRKDVSIVYCDCQLSGTTE